jgi:hypothetical protein
MKIYKNTILPIVLYGCETWSFTLKERHRLRMFENRALRKIFGPKKDQITEGQRIVHNLCPLPNIVRMVK